MSSSGTPLSKFERAGWIFFPAILLRVALELSYVFFVNPYFSYLGLTLRLDVFKYVESWIIYFSLIMAFPRVFLRASDYMMTYLLYSFLAPLLVFYALADASREHLYYVLLSVVLVAVFREGKPFRFKFVRYGRILAYLLIFSGCIIVTGWLIARGGFNTFNLNLALVYDIREEVAQATGQGIMGYLNIWTFKVFGPTLLAVFLWKRNYVLASFMVGLHIVWFGISTNRSILFFPFLVIFLWTWFRRSRSLLFVPFGMFIVVSFSYLFYFFAADSFLPSLTIRRAFFSPALNTFSYYEFFSENQLIYWSNSVTSAFISYPYDLSPAMMIGDHRGTDSNVNNSFLSTGYMHAGVIGVVLYGVICGFLFRIYDSLSYKGVPPWVAVASLIVPTHSLLTSADLLTALLTHGVAVSMIVLFLLRSKRLMRSDRELP